MRDETLSVSNSRSLLYTNTRPGVRCNMHTRAPASPCAARVLTEGFIDCKYSRDCNTGLTGGKVWIAFDLRRRRISRMNPRHASQVSESLLYRLAFVRDNQPFERHSVRYGGRRLFHGSLIYKYRIRRDRLIVLTPPKWFIAISMTRGPPVLEMRTRATKCGGTQILVRPTDAGLSLFIPLI